MKPLFFQVDSFTAQPFHGNPAGVCILTESRSPEWMQMTAREMNCSETAFLHRDGDRFQLRWFTPAVEVDLCGHATLASAHILWERKLLDPDEDALFETRSGLLRAALRPDRIEMDFPAVGPASLPDPETAEAVLGFPVRYAGTNDMDLLVEVESADLVRRFNPEGHALRKLPYRGVILTSRSDDPEFDFISRFFAPLVGIEEDPVTGSAHCCLGPYWEKQLGKTTFKAFQASPRGGTVWVENRGDRVLLGGQAVTVFRIEPAQAVL